jgi:hypothetical protein
MRPSLPSTPRPEEGVKVNELARRKLASGEYCGCQLGRDLKVSEARIDKKKKAATESVCRQGPVKGGGAVETPSLRR